MKRDPADEDGPVGAHRAEGTGLRTERDLSRHLFDLAPAIVLVLDPAARIVNFNSYFEELSGSSLEGMVGESWIDAFVPKRDRKQVRQILNDAVNGLDTHGHVYSILTRDGREREIVWYERTLENEQGDVNALLAIGQDVTDLRRAERVERVRLGILRAATEVGDLRSLISTIRDLLGTLIDTTNFYVALYDPDTDTYRFPFYADTHDSVGPDETEALPGGLTDYVRRTGEPQLVDDDRHAELIDRGEAELFGTPSPLWMGAPLKTERGVIGVVAVQSYDDPKLYGESDLELLAYAADTIAIAVDRKRTETELTESQRNLSLILDTVDNALFQVSVEGADRFRFRSANNAFLRLTGLSEDQILGELIEDVIPQPNRKAVIRNSSEAVRSKSTVTWEDTRVFPAGEVTAIVSVTPAVNDSGECTHLVGSAHDISQRKRAESVERVLRGILRAATMERDLPALLSEIRDLLGALIDTTNFYVALYDPDTEMYRFPFYADEYDTVDPDEPEALPKGLTDYVRRTGQPQFVDVERGAELMAQGEVELVGTDSAVWMGAPLKTERGVFGVVAVQSYHDPNLYTRRDLGLLYSAAGTISIVLERTRAIDALRKSEELIRSIVEHSTNLFYSHTPDHVVTYVSPRTQEFFGCEPEEAMVRWTELATDNPVNERGFEITQRAIDTGEAQPPYELEAKMMTGGTKWVEVREAPVVRDGRTVAIVGALTDITDRKRAEEDLRSSEKRFRLLFERNLAGVYRTTVDGQVLECNQAYASILGYSSPEEVQAVNAFDLYDDADVRRRWVAELQRSGSVTAWEQPQRRKDGSRVWVLLSASLTEDEEGKLTIIDGSLIDVSERKRLETQLAQVQKLEALGQLAGGIAHDFNNLLMAISGSTSLLELRFPQIAADTHELATIRKTVKRGAELTRRLLAIARQQVLRMETLDLNQVIDDELEILRRVIPENIAIHFHPSPDLPPVRADRGQLSQVLMNLCVNARDAMLHGGIITLDSSTVLVENGTGGMRPESHEAGPHVCLSVADTGDGMDAATRERVFEPFFTTKPGGEGTGMGLATVYGIVRQHDGFIEVDSAPGKGTRFVIYLPASDHPAEEGEDVREKELVRGTETILVVEDEQAVRAAVVKMLAGLGYTVLQAADGEKALDLIQGNGGTIDLVLSDVVMPRMGGRELLERSREIEPEMSFLFSSGYTDARLRTLLDLERRTTFIAKPFSLEALATAVREAIDG
jgi:PAS domain S-box-containing protein